MKIYIDGLFYSHSGIGRYYSTIMRELAKRNFEIYTVVYVGLKEKFEKEFIGFINKKIYPIYVSYKKFSIKAFLFRSYLLRKLEKFIEVFFFPHWDVPLYIPNNSILTIHDGRVFTRFWDRSKIKKFIGIFLLKYASKRAKKIVTVSYTSKERICDNIPYACDKTNVIYLFVDEKFTNYREAGKPVVDFKYILFVGNRKKYKNVERLVKAYNYIRDEIEEKLVIVGKRDKDNKKDHIDELISRLNLSKYVIQIENASDEVLINLYKHASLFVFPSLFEGFGIPPLEALSLNCPVIVSRIPVLIETLGDKIAIFDPNDERDIAKKILKVLKDKNTRLEIIDEGRKRLKQLFDKQDIMNKYISIFENLKVKESQKRYEDKR